MLVEVNTEMLKMVISYVEVNTFSVETFEIIIVLSEKYNFI